MTENKFFKNKKHHANDTPAIIPSQKMVAKKKDAQNSNKRIKKKESLGYVAAMRQTTLSESFDRGSLRSRLRPRKNSKSYKDSSSISLLLEKSISPDKRNSFVLLEKINGPKEGKEPIYRSTKLGRGDESGEDKDSVYEFQFDDKDPDEKVGKNNKRKKKVTRKRTVTTNKKKKTNLLAKNNNNKATDNKAEELSKVNSIPAKVEEEVTNVKKVEPLKERIDNTGETESGRVPERDKTVLSSEKLPASENAEEKISPRVRICSVEKLTGDRKVSFKPNLSLNRQNSAKFNPFRSTQSIFKRGSVANDKDMMEHSLFNKSLSPIKGCLETFDAASPWRPPVLDTFFRVKQAVQSTPQIKKNFGRVTRGFRIDEIDENEENGGAKTDAVDKEESKKSANPLGVKIFNAENIHAANSKKNDHILAQETTASVSKIVKDKKVLGLASNYGENIKNSGFGDRLYKSPNKNDKTTTSLGSPGFKRRNNPLVSRGEITENLVAQKKNSVLENEDENTPPLEEPKFLKQSKLNTFLNLDEIPESINISTSHGIFGDTHSTPAVKTFTSKTQTLGNIENCFGFDDDFQSDVQTSPVLSESKENTPVKKIFKRLKSRVLTNEKQGAARISLGEIKNTLYPRTKKKFDKIERGEETNEKREAVDITSNKNTRGQKTEKETKEILNPVQFSDTFDVLSESTQDEGKDKSLGGKLALFADLEPVHFTKPPRWSYAKKREHKQYWPSDEEDSGDDREDRDAPVPKKRKLVKNKVEEKKIEEWVKSVNETFQEIDEFDLVVEKLS